MNITQEQNDKRKVDLINDTIFFQERLDELWKYSPENPNQVDVLFEMAELKRIIAECEEELKNL